MSTMSKEQMVAQIVENLEYLRGRPTPAYALVTGSGFSSPIVPTAPEMVVEDIPWWLFCQKEAGADYFSGKRPGEFTEFRKRLWKQLMKEYSAASIELDSETGLPEADFDNVAAAYRAMMSSQTTQGLFSPGRRKDYFRAVMRRAGGRLNRAHTYLAGLLRAQEDWSDKALFCRTIFSSGFDPMLQQGIGLANLLYSMSDSLERGVDLIGEDFDDAIRLVYTGGSVYRAIYAESPPEGLGERAAAKLNSYLQAHGLIVVGYGGGDDLLMDALRRCRQFDSQLYWCDVHPSPDRLGSAARKLLANSDNCFYVQAEAGEFMRDLHSALTGQPIPAFIVNPIPAFIQQLSDVVLESDEQQNGVLQNTLTRLEEVRDGFDNPSTEVSQIAALINEATEAMLSDDGATALELWAQVLEIDAVTPGQQATAYFNLAEIRRQLGDNEEALEHYSAVIGLPGASTEQIVLSHMASAAIHNQSGQVIAEVSDYSAVIEMDGVSPSQRARALMARSAIYGDSGETERMIADYDAVIALEGALPEQKARAHLGRAFIYAEAGDTEREMADYSAVIAMADAPSVELANAYLNRGVAYGQDGDTEKTIADCSAVIGMEGISREETVNAYLNRGIAYGQEGRFARAIDDYTSVIEMDGLSDEEIANVYLNRSFAYGQEGQPRKEIADCTVVIKMAGALPDQKAKAHLNRSVAHSQVGDAVKAMADYSAVIKMGDVSPEQKALAYAGRGLMLFENEEFDQAVDDCRRAWELDTNSSIIGLNLGLMHLCKGDSGQAIAVYTEAISACQSSEMVQDALDDLATANEQHGPFGSFDEIESLFQEALKALDLAACLDPE